MIDFMLVMAFILAITSVGIGMCAIVQSVRAARKKGKAED